MLISKGLSGVAVGLSYGSVVKECVFLYTLWCRWMKLV